MYVKFLRVLKNPFDSFVEESREERIYMQKLLFLCSQNRRRSLTAEKIFDGYENCKARSAGTESNARVKVTAGMIGWADIIFCMEKKHVRRIKEKYTEEIREKKIVCLNIPDDYENMDEELQQILMSSVEEYLD